MPTGDHPEAAVTKRPASPKTAPPRPLHPPGAGPVEPAQLQSRLAGAMSRIAALEEQMARLLAAVVLTPAGDVEIRSAGALKLSGGAGGLQVKDAAGNGLAMGPLGIEIQAASRLGLAAGVMKCACSSLAVDAPMAMFSGVVKSSTVITGTVAASTYTPGAGNIW